MNVYGIIFGIFTLIIIGLGHVLVIKGEYYFGKKLWPVFLAAGIGAIIVSLLIKNKILSGVLGVTSFALFWAIHELIEQEERVRKGWFPANPKKHN